MTETKIKKESTASAKRLDIKESRLSTTTIERKIKELQKSMKQQDIDNVVRLLCLYLCVMLLFSNKVNSVNWLYVHYMEDLEKVKEYDWASAVSKYLLDSIHKNHRDIKQLKGSSILLLQDEEIQPMVTDNDTEATAALVLLGKKEDEVCEEGAKQKDEIHVGEEDKICGHHGDEVQVSAEQKQNEVEICTEQEKDEVEEICQIYRD
ncbi:hypothetical protein Vadar_018198 [Vaccinium darrowii]|uniref:Uncharacterized protein n=1 Tax=Vaccinium darrowii TaxID=229202 RepID=A0ACB7X2G0_9ERIC|nr:hypothetical protein Vadar_018198 [Vaccinium darrowii]